MAEYPAGGLEYHAINIIAQGRNTHAKESHRHTSNRHGMARRFTHSLFSYSIPAGITSGHTDRGKTGGRIS